MVNAGALETSEPYCQAGPLCASLTSPAWFQCFSCCCLGANEGFDATAAEVIPVVCSAFVFKW